MTRTLARTLAFGGLLLVLAFALAACSGYSTATIGPSTAATIGPSAAPTTAPASVAPATTDAASEAPPASAAAAATTGPTLAPASVAPATTAAVSEAPPASAAAAGGCSVGSAPATVALSIRDFAFSPGTVTVKVGDVLGWKNDDSAAHTVTLDDGSCDTGRIGGGSAGDRTFVIGADAAGRTFSYHCAIHPRMTATIVVSP